ncbi:hypothetical protein [Desulfovibrio psychrotolerans]|uniref:Uncharacterized protein n=1 Tax=Desulfovibrio psychrotolerans TaxID=415242 RepID=A0A7J0BNZ7_9BACT|nr:hypothetical protein [Desulfovibrio psychrotolerans]GFM35338.1 hypothetical protein DSM19430T_00220 [Desulfovibrio psychrotolerans]
MCLFFLTIQNVSKTVRTLGGFLLVMAFLLPFLPLNLAAGQQSPAEHRKDPVLGTSSGGVFIGRDENSGDPVMRTAPLPRYDANATDDIMNQPAINIEIAPRLKYPAPSKP